MTSKSFSIIAIVISVLIATLGGNGVVKAQTSSRANIDYLNDQQFPLVKAYVSLSDAQSQPIQGLAADDFSVSEDSLSIKPLKVEEIQKTEQPLAIVLAMDVSGSMGSAALGNAVEAAKTFVNGLTDQDQIAVIKFADAPTVVQQLTPDKNAVNSALDELKPEAAIPRCMMPSSKR